MNFSFRKIFLVFLIVFICFQNSNADKYDSLFVGYEKKIINECKRNKIPGFSVALVDKHQTLWKFAIGSTDLKRSKKVDTQTIFSIQSISKTFTATAVLHAVENGLLNLDEPISTYLPEFKVNSCFEENPIEKMTLKILLNHRAGFTHEAPIGNNFDASFGSFEEHVLSIQDTWLKFPVGERYSYSNLGIDLAGFILQEVSGMPFHDYVRINIFEPLGMDNSSFETNWIVHHKNRAAGNDEIIPKVPVEIPLIPSGGMYSCAEDMANYARFHLNNGEFEGKQVLLSETLETMYKIPFGYPGQNFGYALGLDNMGRNNTLGRNHGGGGFGFLSFLVWYPEFDFGIVTLSNSTNHQFYLEIAHEIADDIIALKRKELGISDVKELSGFPGQQSIRTLTEEPGPNKTEWKKWLGNYRYYVFGFPVWHEKIEIINGHLHYAGQQLEECEEGLFLTADGEALDLRGKIPTFRNIKLERFGFSLFEEILIGIIALCFLVFIIGEPIKYFQSKATKTDKVENRFIVIFSTIVSLVGIGYLYLLVFYVPYILGTSWPWNSLYPVDIKIVWILPYFWIVLVAILLVASLLKKWIKKSVRLNVFSKIVVGGGILFILLLNYWNQF